MKSRLSYFLISVIIILLVFTGILIWNKKNLQEIPKFNKKSFAAPISSKYIPTNSDLVFHWKINPTIVPNYIRTYQSKVNQNISNKKIKFIRDASFQLISLDFEKDISKWVGNYGSFTIFDSNKELIDDWLMVLGVKNGINIEEELESILDVNLIKENDQNTTKSSELKISSKKINSNKSIYFATEKDNVLIASNPKIIKSSIDQLDNKTLNTREKYKNIQLKDNLKDGFLLIEMSPKQIFNLIGQEEKLLELNQAKKLISSINIDENRLNIEGIISYDNKIEMPANDLNYNSIDMKKEIESFNDFILIDNPKQYFMESPRHPYQNLIASVIKKSATSDYSHLFKIILENSKGYLTWINDKDWLVLTKKSDTSKKEINNILIKENFLNSNLEFKKRNLEVWSKISANENEKDEIEENIEAIIEEQEGTYLWSQNLSSISHFDDAKYLPNYLDSENKIDKMNDFNDILKIHLGEEKTETFLNNFYPYILFKIMLGNQLNFAKNIDIAIGVPTINYSDFIKFEINLKTS
tara:strand:- start:912 stop:2492 length:1581 start_codon:yes stop_codon:yes gene_type:complete